MATNTAALKTFAQETRKKLISLISTKMDFILTQDTAELRGFESQIAKLKSAIASKGKGLVVEEVAYTWFNRVMALRYMDANGYTDLKVVTPGMGQMRPEILQEAMAGNIDEDLRVKVDDNPKEAVLYRRLLVAVCNQYGTSMPFLFEHICDYTEMLLPDDLLSDQSFVTDIRNGMTDDDCQNVEVMGWLYQFYITDRKADAETKKSKKGGLKSDEQAAATQLFTPHWVVRYMVENSLGRIWMTLHPESRLIDDMPYYIQTPEGQTDTIPVDIHSVQDIRFIDPCMGSGHVLVYAFDLFCKMYEEEGYQTREIPALILQNNIYGLDIDRRCYQLASFALTMKGCAYYSRYLRKVVEPNVIALQPIDHDTIEASGAWGQKSLMWQFENIDTIGSLLKVTPEECAAISVDSGLFGVNQQILKTQAEYLSRKYHCVVTNPPYLGKGFCDDLKNYVTTHFPNSKADLYAAFIECAADKVCNNGYTGLVTMESWMFISSYELLRKYLIENKTIISLSHYDWHIMRIAFGTVAFVLQNRLPKDYIGVYSYLNRNEVDFQKELPYEFPNKSNGKYRLKNQSEFMHIPGCSLGYWASKSVINNFDANKLLDKELDCLQGIITGNTNKYLRLWTEVNHRTLALHTKSFNNSKYWISYTKGGSVRKWYGNNEYTIYWKNGGEYLVRNRSTNSKYYLKPCFTWTLIGTSGFTTRYCDEGFLWDVSGSIGVPYHNNWKTVLGFMNTKLVNLYLKILNPTINTNIEDVNSLPLSLPIGSSIECIEKSVEYNISISRLDWDSHETSWDFQRNPLWEQQLDIILDEMRERGVFSEDATIDDIGPFNLPDLLQPLGILVENYQSEWEDRFHQLHRNEEELNRKFIEIYGLQDELTPDVPLDEITILQKGEISVKDNKIVWHKDVIMKQFISWMVGCFMGRYSADKPGLIIASQGQKVADLDLPAMTLEIDDDGIIPIIQESDFFADDMTQRIEAGVKALFGEQNFYYNMKYIKACLGQELRDYLYKDYYDDHMQMYSVKGAKRPIYWLFSSKMGDKKKKGYFKALVYMHRMESDTLSKLHADYVSPYIDKVEQQLKEAEDDAVRDDLSQAQRNKANKLAAELADKVREVKEFATILAQMSTQRLTIDLDDGVKVNYPKYYPLVELIKGLESKDE